jgi:hypothetical protein
MFPGVSDYGNYNGFNLRYVPSLRQALLHYGWSQSSAGQWCGSAGQVSDYSPYSAEYRRFRDDFKMDYEIIPVLVQVLIYNNDEHAALAIGNCLLDQHNPARCGSGAQWGSNVVMKP